jgi:hypothetical protein
MAGQKRVNEPATEGGETRVGISSVRHGGVVCVRIPSALDLLSL